MNATSKQATYEESTCPHRGAAGVYSTRKSKPAYTRRTPENQGYKTRHDANLGYNDRESHQSTY